MNRRIDRKTRVFLGDLAYTNPYAAPMITVPLNIGYVASYLRATYRDECDVVLFKDPEQLLASANLHPPDVLGLSCYFWNLHLDVLVASRVRAANPDCTVAIGGPNVDTDLDEQIDLHRAFKSALDFLVLNDGEPGFSNIVGALFSGGRDHLFDGPIGGCTYVDASGRPVVGEDVGLSLDLETVPSPILTGLLDPFLDPAYLPMIQTSRMCPYSCAYCCSGKLRGRIRTFPEAVVKDEIAYIARRYRDHPHRTLYITDDNFGINDRDTRIAQYLVDAREAFGYPQQTFCYFDKKFTSTVKESALLFGDMNAGGFQLAFQSFNDDTLAAVRRSNISDEEVREAVCWAHDHGLKVSTEMIFGLPYETKRAFLDALECLMQLKIDTSATHNLFLLKGIELNRIPERERFGLATRFRPSFAASYGTIDGEFVCESEEIVVASSHFSFEDFMDVRKITLLYYAINAAGYFGRVINFLVDNQVKVVPLLDQIINPSRETDHGERYAAYVNDFTSAARAELHNNHEDVFSHLKARYVEGANRVTQPARLNVWYTARLIYQEHWFGEVLSRLLKERGIASRILEDLIAVSENEWIDLRDPQRSNTLEVCKGALDCLGIEPAAPAAERYCLTLAPTDRQIEALDGYNEQYHTEDDSYYYNALDVIVPRANLRFARVTAVPLDDV